MNIAVSENRFYVSWDDYRTLNFNVSVLPFECFRWVDGEIIEVPLEPVPNAALATACPRAIARGQAVDFRIL